MSRWLETTTLVVGEVRQRFVLICMVSKSDPWSLFAFFFIVGAIVPEEDSVTDFYDTLFEANFVRRASGPLAI
jgi:hypothetical protein